MLINRDSYSESYIETFTIAYRTSVGAIPSGLLGDGIYLRIAR